MSGMNPLHYVADLDQLIKTVWDFSGNNSWIFMKKFKNIKGTELSKCVQCGAAWLNAQGLMGLGTFVLSWVLFWFYYSVDRNWTLKADKSKNTLTHIPYLKCPQSTSMNTTRLCHKHAIIVLKCGLTSLASWMMMTTIKMMMIMMIMLTPSDFHNGKVIHLTQ